MSKFSPRVGVLYARLMNSVKGSEMSYCYLVDEKDKTTFKQICRMINFVVYPLQEEFKETNFDIVQKQGEYLSPVGVYWRPCTPDDLKAIKMQWQPEITFPSVNYVSYDDWYRGIVSKENKMPEQIKHGLWKVLRQFHAREFAL